MVSGPRIADHSRTCKEVVARIRTRTGTGIITDNRPLFLVHIYEDLMARCTDGCLRIRMQVSRCLPSRLLRSTRTVAFETTNEYPWTNNTAAGIETTAEVQVTWIRDKIEAREERHTAEIGDGFPTLPKWTPISPITLMFRTEDLLAGTTLFPRKMNICPVTLYLCPGMLSSLRVKHTFLRQSITTFQEMVRVRTILCQDDKTSIDGRGLHTTDADMKMGGGMLEDMIVDGAGAREHGIGTDLRRGRGMRVIDIVDDADSGLHLSIFLLNAV